MKTVLAVAVALALGGCGHGGWETTLAQEVQKPTPIPQCEMDPEPLRKMTEEDKSDVDAAREYDAQRRQAKRYRAQLLSCRTGLRARDGR